MTPRSAIPSSWADRLTDGPISLGQDLATTERGTSNPSGLAVQQRVGRQVMTRLMVSWKTSDPSVTRQVLAAVLDDIEAKRMKPRRLVVDASNEKFFASDLRKQFGGRVAVELIGGNNKIKFRGEELDAKTLLGNLYVSAIEDGFLLLPGGEWIMLDHRLVKREAGGFQTDTGPNGEHGDTFDAGKLAYYGLQSTSGTVRAEALQVGSFGGMNSDSKRPVFTDPWMDGIARQNLEGMPSHLA
jgi:hypothetical protein